MATNTKIEWTEATWNPVAGCTVLSPGCTNCYAMRMASRLERMGQRKYRGTTRKSGGRAKWTGRINLDRGALEQPRTWKSGRLIFVNSMSDLFHENVPTEYIMSVFEVMVDTPRHRYQILTKRPERVLELSKELPWASNIWMGVSVENSDFLGRVDLLRESGSAVKFLSLEPLLGPLDGLSLAGIDWVIVGGESGPNSREIKTEWVTQIRDRCVADGVAFHFKQWGGTNKKKNGRLLDGRTWDQFPILDKARSSIPLEVAIA